MQEEPEEDNADEQNDEQEVRDPGRQHLAAAFLHSHPIFFPKAMIPSTTRVTSAATVTIFLKSNERTRMKGSRSTTAVMTRRSTRKILIALDPRTRRVIRHGLSPRAYLLNAASGRVPYILNDNDKRNNNNDISNTKPWRLVFGAETTR